MRNKELRRDYEARNLSREERKMMVIMRQIEEMEQKATALKAAPRLDCLYRRSWSVLIVMCNLCNMWRGAQQSLRIAK